VVPVGLLATFKLSGIFEGPATVADTITLDEVKWEFERPSCPLDFRDYVESSYVNDIFIDQDIFVYYYFPDAGDYGGSPILQMNLSLTANLAEGHVENVNITFHDDYLNSFVSIPDLEFGGKHHTLAVWDNLTVTSYKINVDGSVEKAFVHFDGVNQPRRVFLRVFPLWVLKSPNNQTQQLNIFVEVTYFNGTVYKKVIQPFQLRLIAENNDSFENAEEISTMPYTKKHFLGGDNTQDFYKLYLTEGEIINITMMPPAVPPTADFDLYLYNPTDRNTPVASSTNPGGGAQESITYTSDSTGFWYIKVIPIAGAGIYMLALT
jgi:hypothetical protein